MSVTLLTESLLPARRDEGDGCQLVEAAVMGRALSTRSCTGLPPTSARCPRGKPTSYTTRRRAGGNLQHDRFDIRTTQGVPLWISPRIFSEQRSTLPTYWTASLAMSVSTRFPRPKRLLRRPRTMWSTSAAWTATSVGGNQRDGH